MKAFDEWYMKHAKENPWRRDSDFIKDAWNAALVWVLQEVYSQDENGWPSWKVEDLKHENLDECYTPVNRIVEELNS